VIKVDPANTASIAVAERSGFAFRWTAEDGDVRTHWFTRRLAL
jgi:RimJ/RimL family protein N-acetyltransferase